MNELGAKGLITLYLRLGRLHPLCFAWRRISHLQCAVQSVSLKAVAIPSALNLPS